MLLLWLSVTNTFDDIVARNIEDGRMENTRAPFNVQAFNFSRPMTETLEEDPVSDRFLERLIRAQVQYSALQLQSYSCKVTAAKAR